MTIKFLNKSFSFSIDKIKVLYGKKSEITDIFNNIRSFFLKLQASENMKELNCNTEIIINDTILSQKEFCLLEFQDYFDMLNEYKLGTKSVMLKFFDAYLNNIDFNEDVSTLNILLSDFYNKIEDDLKEEGFNLFLNPLELTKKTILQNLTFSFGKDGNLTNQQDYSAIELIDIQKKIFKYIIKNNKQMKYLIIDDKAIPNIMDLSAENVFILTNECISENINDYYLTDEKIDFFDENEFYEKFLNDPLAYDYDVYRENMLKLFLEN